MHKMANCALPNTKLGLSRVFNAHTLLAGNVQSGIHRSGHSSGDDDILQWAVTGVSCHIGNLVYHLHSRNDLRETILTFFLKTVYKNLPFQRRSVYCPDEAEWQE